MISLPSKNDDSSLMTSSLRFKILKIDKFCDFSCDFDYNSSVKEIIVNQPLSVVSSLSPYRVTLTLVICPLI